MKVILKKLVPDLGEAGAVVNVKDGFARNYLIPQGLAQAATGDSLKYLGRMKGFREKKNQREAKEAGDLAARIGSVTVTVAKPVGEQDRLFGTVTAMELAEALAGQGLEVDRRKIVIAEPIKSLGSYTATVKLHAEVQAELKIEVVRED